MPYEPIHHKYRPQTFKDLVGQETIALTLINAIKQEKIAPAYLFTGPRGTGKTSSARILAKSLNCLNSKHPTPEPCGKCEACRAIANGSALDVMEIDAASNTGVDNIREIIERSRFAPVQCRYKVYAIDECHMLSTAAFNALLKTLEEPPPQVVFILATTDPQRVLSTIISRCQRFDYRRIPLPAMVSHLKYIAETETIAIADDALTLIAQIANGGLRDAESLLDQLSLFPDTISVAKVWELVGAVPEQDLCTLLQAINSNDSVAVLQQCRSLLDRGCEPIVVLQNLAGFYLNLLIAKTAPQRPEMTAVTETCWQQLCTEATNWDLSAILQGQQHLKAAETQLKQTTQPRLWLEVTLLGLLPQALSSPIQHQSRIAVDTVTVTPSVLRSSPEAITPVTLKTTNAPPQTTPVTEKPAAIESLPTPPQNVPAVPSPSATKPSTTNTQFDLEKLWQQVVTSLHPPTTQALFKQQCHLLSFDGSSAIVGISSAKLQKLHQGKVPNIEKAFAQVLEQTVKVQLEATTNNHERAINSAMVNAPNPPQIEPPASAATVSSAPPTYQQTPAPQFEPPEEVVTTTISSTVSSLPATSATVNDRISSKPENSVASLNPSVTTTTTTTTTDTDTDNVVEPTPKSLDVEYGDQDLQKAIANLTQSFEGELVEMDLESSDKDRDSLVLSANPAEIPETSDQQNRPDLEEYGDDW